MRPTWLERARRTLLANLRTFFLLWRRFRLSLTVLTTLEQLTRLEQLNCGPAERRSPRQAQRAAR